MRRRNRHSICLSAVLVCIACSACLAEETSPDSALLLPLAAEARPIQFELSDDTDSENPKDHGLEADAQDENQAALKAESNAAQKAKPQPDAKSKPQSNGTTSKEPAAKTSAPKASGFRIEPYGVAWADMIFETNPTNPGAFTLWVFSADSQVGGQSVIDARRSRLGLNVEGPKLSICGDANSHAQFEIDFFGQFVNENQSNLQLRLAYWETFNDEFKFLVGQTYDVISPRNTRMLNYSVGWAGGNIGFRRAQFRWERYWKTNSRETWIGQVSLNQDIVNDFAAEPTVRREPAAWPVIEGRGAIQIASGQQGAEKFELGVSAHFGEVGFDFLANSPPPVLLPPENDVRLITWSTNVDWMLPVSDRVSIQGEVFTGANLSAYLGGIVQGVCSCTREVIHSTGGWADLEYRWTDRIKAATGLGIDDPNNSDFLFGRTRNQFLFANVTWQIRPELLTGIEVSYWQTRYQDRRAGLIPDALLAPTAPGNAVVVQWMWKYNF